MRTRVLVTLVMLFSVNVFTVAVPRDAAALDFSLDTDVYENRKLGVSFAVPEGWRLSRHTGYPSLLAIVTRDKARICLSQATLKRQQKLVQVVTDNNRALTALRFRITKSTRRSRRTENGDEQQKTWYVAAAHGQFESRQYYLPAGRRIYTVTLTAPRARIATLQRDFAYLLDSFRAKAMRYKEEERVNERGKKGKKPPVGTPGAVPRMGGLQELGGEKEPRSKDDKPDNVADTAKRGRPPKDWGRPKPGLPKDWGRPKPGLPGLMQKGAQPSTRPRSKPQKQPSSQPSSRPKAQPAPERPSGPGTSPSATGQRSNPTFELEQKPERSKQR
jgi:hypothetical protein